MLSVLEKPLRSDIFSCQWQKYVNLCHGLMKCGPRSGDTETGEVGYISKVQFVEDLYTQTSTEERTEAGRRQTHR